MTQSGSEKLYEDVIAELRKISSVSLVSDASEADAILGGGGEIWIKGYLSHNPRLTKVPPNGSAVYNGFLSVELRNTNGQTLWSYLATPPAESADVAKDLSIKIVRNLAASLNEVETVSRSVPLPQATSVLQGAGATFPYPVYRKWFTNYRRENPALQINYETIGSEAGARKLIANSVDFAASDSPKVMQELSPVDEKNICSFLP